jgi:hypothetical protein
LRLNKASSTTPAPRLTAPAQEYSAERAFAAARLHYRATRMAPPLSKKRIVLSNELRCFGHPLLSQLPATPGAGAQSVRVTTTHRPLGNEAFQPLPLPATPPPFRMSLESVVGQAQIDAIRSDGKLVFHAAGDTGGIRDAVPQTVVVKKLIEQLSAAGNGPSFFYHLGDVVHFKGQAAEFYPQFYEPYEHYTAPIFAIPGNHDGMPPGDGAPPLDAFMRNFCNRVPRITPEAGDVPRTAMTQPYCHFTLEAPFVTFIGLYSNVPSGGRIHNDQLQWLIGELKAASKQKALILAVHHPIYSADEHHGGDEHLESVIHGAFDIAKRIPQAVLSGHVHNYQRFTRQFGHRSVPYLIIGAGGYHNLHGMLKAPDGGDLAVPLQITTAPSLRLERYKSTRHGFARITASANELLFEYFTVPRRHESWSSPAMRFDSCRLNWRTGQILPSG